MQSIANTDPRVETIGPTLVATLERFEQWLGSYGETSQDHQDFFIGEIGKRAKRVYYRLPVVGTLAVLPMVACEAFAPGTRRWFWRRMRHPIADAHFALGFAQRFHATHEQRHHDRAVEFLTALIQTRSPGFSHYGWGYPFDWETRNGVIPAGTPLITTVPYCYEAFDDVYQIDDDERWHEICRSIADHALLDYRNVVIHPGSATCTYTPYGGERVVNASAYRSFLLFRAARDFEDSKYEGPARENLQFVLDAQQPDGSWPYAVDGVRPFVDHFHTCFVLKALTKIERLRRDPDCTRAIDRGLRFYVDHLFDVDRLPKPFSRAPRLTVYKRELYDCAECINLGILLRGRSAELDQLVDYTVVEILAHWVAEDGAFRSRKLLIGWDNVPMFRWGQAAMFHSLARYLNEVGSGAEKPESSDLGSTPHE